jgi:hypothetical protein
MLKIPVCASYPIRKFFQFRIFKQKPYLLAISPTQPVPVMGDSESVFGYPTARARVGTDKFPMRPEGEAGGIAKTNRGRMYKL